MLYTFPFIYYSDEMYGGNTAKVRQTECQTGTKQLIVAVQNNQPTSTASVQQM